MLALAGLIIGGAVVLALVRLAAEALVQLIVRD